MRQSTAALILAAVGGCSFIGVRGSASNGVDCTDGVAAPVLDTIVTAGLIAAFVKLFIVAHDDACQGQMYCGLWSDLGAAAMIASIPPGASAFWGYSTVSECKSFKQERSEARQRAKSLREQRAIAARSARERAWTLTKQLAVAARSGDCSDAIATSSAVHDLDPEFHDTVFVRDEAIKNCLEKNGIEVEPPKSLPAPPPQLGHIARREQAFGLVKTASRAARSGDCDTALAVQTQVRELDASVYDAWFVRDEAIKRCLDAASSRSDSPSSSSEAVRGGTGVDVAPEQ